VKLVNIRRAQADIPRPDSCAPVPLSFRPQSPWISSSIVPLPLPASRHDPAPQSRRSPSCPSRARPWAGITAPISPRDGFRDTTLIYVSTCASRSQPSHSHPHSQVPSPHPLPSNPRNRRLEYAVLKPKPPDPRPHITATSSERSSTGSWGEREGEKSRERMLW